MPLDIRPLLAEDMPRIGVLSQAAMADPANHEPGGRFFELCYPDYKTDEGLAAMTERLELYRSRFPATTHAFKVVDTDAADPDEAIAMSLYTEDATPPGPPPSGGPNYWAKYPGLIDYIGELFGHAMKYRFQIYDKGPNLTLHALATHPQHQHRGAATLLMKEVIARADKLGYITQVDSTIFASAFYQTFGLTGQRLQRPQSDKWNPGPVMEYDILSREPAK